MRKSDEGSGRTQLVWLNSIGDWKLFSASFWQSSSVRHCPAAAATVTWRCWRYAARRRSSSRCCGGDRLRHASTSHTLAVKSPLAATRLRTRQRLRIARGHPRCARIDHCPGRTTAVYFRQDCVTHCNGVGNRNRIRRGHPLTLYAPATRRCQRTKGVSADCARRRAGECIRDVREGRLDGHEKTHRMPREGASIEFVVDMMRIDHPRRGKRERAAVASAVEQAIRRWQLDGHETSPHPRRGGGHLPIKCQTELRFFVSCTAQSSWNFGARCCPQPAAGRTVGKGNAVWSSINCLLVPLKG